MIFSLPVVLQIVSEVQVMRPRHRDVLHRMITPVGPWAFFRGEAQLRMMSRPQVLRMCRHAPGSRCCRHRSSQHMKICPVCIREMVWHSDSTASNSWSCNVPIMQSCMLIWSNGYPDHNRHTFNWHLLISLSKISRCVHVLWEVYHGLSGQKNKKL